MIIIDLPTIDDIGELQKLADNNRLGSYPSLMHGYLEFRRQYKAYEDNGGDPFKVATTTVTDSDFKRALINHFNQPPEGCLKFIPIFRRELSPLVCPMCGGFGNGTLDHYLPKDTYPEFSVFSKNLIPACNCNNLRGTTVKGTVPSVSTPT